MDVTFGNGSEGSDFDSNTSFIQSSSTTEKYHLVGGFLIEEIDQQKAGDYSAVIEITVTAIN